MLYEDCEMIYIIQRLINLKNLEAVDLVEINPDLDLNNLTIRLGAKLISEFNKKI
jgi:arginase family enzyme